MENMDNLKKYCDIAGIGLDEKFIENILNFSNEVLTLDLKLSEINLEHIEAYKESLCEKINILRKDIPHKSIERENALKNSVSTEYGYFKLNKVID